MNPTIMHDINLISNAQVLINDFLGSKNKMVYAINPDGSFIELQQGCTLLSMERYQMEVYSKGNK